MLLRRLSAESQFVVGLVSWCVVLCCVLGSRCSALHLLSFRVLMEQSHRTANPKEPFTVLIRFRGINFESSSHTHFVLSPQSFSVSCHYRGFTDMPCVEGPVTRKIHVCSHPKFHRRQPSACRAMRFRSMIQRGFVPLELCLEMEQPKADDLERVSERVFQTASGGLDGGLHKKERILPSEWWMNRLIDRSIHKA